MSAAGWGQVVWTKMNPQKTQVIRWHSTADTVVVVVMVRELGVTIIDGRLTMHVHLDVHGLCQPTSIRVLPDALCGPYRSRFRRRRPTWLLQRPSLQWRRRQPALVPSAGTERVICTGVSDSQSVLYANIIPTHASDAYKSNEWLMDSFAPFVYFDDINGWSWTHLFDT